jgi:enolase
VAQNRWNGGNDLLTRDQGIPLYEFLRLESGALKGPYIMPVPFFNVLNGGVHSGNTMAFQEIMIAPVGATSMAGAVQMGAETYHQLKKVITKKFGASGIFPGSSRRSQY